MPHVLITGANRGLGLEFTRQYLAEGWRVTAVIRDPAAKVEIRAAADSPAGELHVEIADLGEASAIEALAARLAPAPIDILLHNAGYMTRCDFGESSWADWESHFKINSYATLKLAEAFVTHLAASEQRRFIALSSRLGSIGGNDSGGLYAYRASKAAANAVIKSLSIDLAPHGIVVLSLHPGWVRTRMGGASAPLDAQSSVNGMRRVIAGATTRESGSFVQWDGQVLPW